MTISEVSHLSDFTSALFVFRPFEGLVVLKELAEGAKENSELFELQKVVAMLAITLGEDAITLNRCLSLWDV